MIDWNLVINPLLSGGTDNFSSENAVSVIQAITNRYFVFNCGLETLLSEKDIHADCVLCSKEEILHHEPNYECFYSSFIALAGNMLAQSSSSS